MKPLSDHDAQYDVLVVGGGINGAAIARDAAGRGLSVLLVEKDDLASHTSGASSKLIHGGLRYLEQYEVALVSKALAEREVVFNSAQHNVKPMRFILPHAPHLRPAWMIRAGLSMYDRLGKRRTRAFPPSRRLRLREHSAGQVLQPAFDIGFIYSDAWCDDARLVVLNALDAQERGAQIATRTCCDAVQRGAQVWRARLRCREGQQRQVTARVLVNATGPWATHFINGIAGVSHTHKLRLVKGSHIVVKKLYAHAYAYTFQQEDRRIVFVIPFEHDYTLIGTTDRAFSGCVEGIRPDADEIEYLCAAVNRYLACAITPEDVVWSYAGVRPLLEEAGVPAEKVTRDYLVNLDKQGGAPLLNVLGGKITTHRTLAEHAINLIAPLLGNAHGAWTGHAHVYLPGGEFARATGEGGTPFDALVYDTLSRYPWLRAGQALRYAHAYGTRLHGMIGTARRLEDLGENFGADLYQAEVDYLVREEWAGCADDILWRRSKLGLRFTSGQRRHLQAYLEAESAA